jgi:hypothetical protein
MAVNVKGHLELLQGSGAGEASVGGGSIVHVA